jgi:glycosyltransferase involved in cell wall biosynthesis
MMKIRLKIMDNAKIGVWLPTIRTGTGTDIFTQRLVDALIKRGIRAHITWLPHRSEYAPWSVKAPRPPSWATVVHINSWLHKHFLATSLPVIVTLHSCVHDPLLTPYKTFMRRYYHQLWIKACEHDNIRRAAAVTAVSEYTATQAQQIFQRQDIIPIHNWIDLNTYVPDERQQPHPRLRLLFVGKPSQHKGFHLLAEIMRRLGNQFELHYTATPKDFSDPTLLPANMFALGRLQGDAALIQAYQNCDVLLFPTRLEGFGLVALEALACGRPVITTQVSSLPEIVVDQHCGFLCAIDDIDGMVTAARVLHDQPQLWRTMSVTARQRALTLFSEEKALARYSALYSHYSR